MQSLIRPGTPSVGCSFTEANEYVVTLPLFEKPAATLSAGWKLPSAWLLGQALFPYPGSVGAWLLAAESTEQPTAAITSSVALAARNLESPASPMEHPPLRCRVGTTRAAPRSPQPFAAKGMPVARFHRTLAAARFLPSSRAPECGTGAATLMLARYVAWLPRRGGASLSRSPRCSA